MLYLLNEIMWDMILSTLEIESIELKKTTTPTNEVAAAAEPYA